MDDTILIVDDENPVRQSVREWLEKAQLGCAIPEAPDAEQAAVAAFQMADANGDGVLDQEEYLTIAMAAESGLAEAAPALEQGEVDIGAPEQQIRAAEADASAVEAAFAEIAGETGEATKDDLRAAFLARFEQADADGDGQLDEEERLTFAALMIGVSDEPQP